MYFRAVLLKSLHIIQTGGYKVTDMENVEKFVKQQPDRTGRYVLRHQLFGFFNPKLFLYRKEENGKVEGEICLLGLKKN